MNLYTVFLVTALTGCALTPVSLDFVRIESAGELAPVFGKRLEMGDSYQVINADGSLSGIMDGQAMFGQWEMKDGLWCQTLTAGSAKVMERSKSCQVLESSISILRSTSVEDVSDIYSYEII